MSMNTLFLKRIAATGITLAFLVPMLAFAATDTPQGFLDKVGTGQGFAANAPSVPTLVANIINISLSVVGALLVGLLVYGGFLWMTARGDTDKIEDATNTIRNAIVGLIIILGAYSISKFVLLQIMKATSGGYGQ